MEEIAFRSRITQYHFTLQALSHDNKGSVCIGHYLIFHDGKALYKEAKEKLVKQV